MTVEHLPAETIREIVASAMAEKWPRTQEDCCAIAARVAVLADDGPWTDDRILVAASAGARGLFGEAFAAADYAQRTAWIDMYERALRKEIV